MEQAYTAPGNYPIPEKLPRNIRYARILLNAHSGRESELTSIHQYIYQHEVAAAENPRASECFSGIAADETRHLELLATTINMLGLRPTYTFYQGTRRVRWNSGFVIYGRNLRDMIEIDLHGEGRAIEAYTHAIKLIADEQIQRLLRRIIEDEQQHIRALTSLRETL